MVRWERILRMEGTKCSQTGTMQSVGMFSKTRENSVELKLHYLVGKR